MQGIFSAKQQQLSPPLPLLRFETVGPEKGVKTITGECIKSIPNQIFGCSGRPEKGDKIHDPVASRRLSRWFTARSQQEIQIRQQENVKKLYSEGSDEKQEKSFFLDQVVYESYLYSETYTERHARSQMRQVEQEILLSRIINCRAQACALPPLQPHVGIAIDDDTHSIHSHQSYASSPSPTSQFLSSPSLVFDAEFESGNLEKAVRVMGREHLPAEQQDRPDCMVCPYVDQEYDLTLRNDINTDGNIQWYYFAATANAEVSGVPLIFPLAVRFNLINMQKKDSLYNNGMKPAVLIVCREEEGEADWHHDGLDVCYYRNGLSSIKAPSAKKKRAVVRSYFSLSFTFVFQEPGTVYFAHAFPYTFSDLKRYLQKLEQDTLGKEFLHCRTLCQTIAGNECQLLTISERGEGMAESKQKPAIFVMARIHPGESNSSFAMQGFLDFITSEALEAKRLRKAFVFFVVPMMNPDGVIHGNYRCSLAGVDLNRRYKDAHPTLHPTVIALRDLVHATIAKRPVLLFLDLHGHSKLKNAFLYGCDITYQPEKISKFLQANMDEEEIALRRLHCRVFPRLLCSISKTSGAGYFSYADCAFQVQKSKSGTGRVVCWKDLGVLGAYTIEISFCGNGDNSEGRILRKMESNLAMSSAPRSGDGGSKASDSSTSVDNMDDNPSDADTGIGDGGDGVKSATGSFISFSNANSTLTIKALQERDPVLAKLLASYRSATHYAKSDLMAMGRQIGLAIYHYTNLTHADLDHEVEQLLQKDREDRERARVIQDALDFRSRSQSGKFRPANSSRSSILSSPSSSNPTPSQRFSSKDELQLAQDDDDDDEDNDDEDEDAENDGEQYLEVNAEDGAVAAETIPSSQQPTQSYLHHTSCSSKSNLSAKLMASNRALQDALSAHCRAVLVNYGDTDVQRSLGRPGVFSAAALQSIMQNYAQEFSIIEKSTINVGVRVKCEIVLRKILRIEDARLKLDKFSIDSGLIENDEGSADGSESNPSIDNDPKAAAALLKSMRQQRDASMIAALRKAYLQKKVDDEMEAARYQAKLLMKLKLKEDADRRRRQAEAAAAAAAAPQPAPAPRPRPSTANTVLRTRRVSLVPRVPVYRLDAQSALKAAPVNITLMSNRDIERTRALQLQSNQMLQMAKQAESLIAASRPQNPSIGVRANSNGAYAVGTTSRESGSSSSSSRDFNPSSTPRSARQEIEPSRTAFGSSTKSSSSLGSGSQNVYLRPAQSNNSSLLRSFTSPSSVPTLTVVAPTISHNAMNVASNQHHASSSRPSTANRNGSGNSGPSSSPLISPLRKSLLSSSGGRNGLPDLLPLLPNHHSASK